MPSIDNIAEIAGRFDQQSISVDALLCVRGRNRNASCSVCVDACDHGAVSFIDGSLSFNVDMCTKCGACVAACPVDALTMANTKTDLLQSCFQAAQSANGVLAIACPKILEKAAGFIDLAKVVCVPCLKSVTPELLIQEVAFADIEKIHLSCSECTTCEKGRGSSSAQQAADTAAEILDAWGASVKIKVSDKLPRAIRLVKDDSLYDPSRRLFFGEMKNSASKAALATVDVLVFDRFETSEEEDEKPRVKVNRYGVLPQGVSGKREGLLKALNLLTSGDLLEIIQASDTNPNQKILGERLWARVDIDFDACKGCRMCASFCPTGALFKFHTKKGLIGVKHDISQCVGCGCCRDTCRYHALSLQPGATLAQICKSEIQRFVLPEVEKQKKLFEASYAIDCKFSV